MKKNYLLFAILTIIYAVNPVFSQPAFSADRESAQLPLKRLALFSSGVGFYEHSGRIAGTAAVPFQITLPFSFSVVNDVLKSLAVNDPLSDSPSVHYASADTLSQSLKSLAVDLSGNRIR